MKRITNPAAYTRIQSFYDQRVAAWFSCLIRRPNGKTKRVSAKEAQALAYHDVATLEFEPFTSLRIPIDATTIYEFMPRQWRTHYLPLYEQIAPLVIAD